MNLSGRHWRRMQMQSFISFNKTQFRQIQNMTKIHSKKKKKTGKESIKQQAGFSRQWRKYVSQTSKLIQNQKRKHGIKGLVTSGSYRCVHFHLWLTSSDLMVNVSSRSESGRSCKIPWWCWTVSPSCCHLQLTWLTGSHRILFQLIQLKF